MLALVPAGRLYVNTQSAAEVNAVRAYLKHDLLLLLLLLLIGMRALALPAATKIIC